jgi:hypothetical protein
LSLRITQLNVISFQTIDIDIAVAKTEWWSCPEFHFKNSKFNEVPIYFIRETKTHLTWLILIWKPDPFHRS